MLELTDSGRVLERLGISVKVAKLVHGERLVDRVLDPAVPKAELLLQEVD
jgi:hypothetical protein